MPWTVARELCCCCTPTQEFLISVYHMIMPVGELNIDIYINHKNEETFLCKCAGAILKYFFPYYEAASGRSSYSLY